MFTFPKKWYFAVVAVLDNSTEKEGKDSTANLQHWRRGELVYGEPREAREGGHDAKGSICLLNIIKVSFAGVSDEVTVGHIADGIVSNLRVKFESEAVASDWGTAFCDLLTALESQTGRSGCGR